MKTIKRTLALILSVVIFALAAMPALAESRKDYSKYKVYTCIGDSVPTGYGVLTGNENNCSYKRVAGSYPDLVAKDLGNIKFNQLAVTGERTVEVRMMLDDSYKGDHLVGKYVNPVQTRDAADKARYRKAVAEADIITIAVCSNDIFTTPVDVLKDDLAAYTDHFDKNMQNDITRLLKENKAYEAAEKILYYAGMIGVLGYAVPELLANMTQGYFQFRENFDAITDIVYEMNPDATVMVLGMISPMSMVPLFDGMPVSESDFDALFLIDDYLKTGCKNAYKYHYVDTLKTESPYSDYSSLLAFYMSKGEHDDVNHPSAKGHRYMADQVMAAIPETQFIDIAESADYDAIVKTYNKGFMVGDGGVYFSPDKSLKKKSLAIALYKAAGHKKAPFEKVKAWAEKTGIVAFDGDENEYVSGEEFISAINRFNRKTGKNIICKQSYETVERHDLAAVLATA